MSTLAIPDDLPVYRDGEYHPCPHCGVPVRFDGGRVASISWRTDCVEHLSLVSTMCPSCKQYVLTLVAKGTRTSSGAHYALHSSDAPQHLVWPLFGTRPVPSEVPEHIAGDYKEAAAVLSVSPKASAALSRRCLETVLSEAGGAKSRNLSAKIDEVAKTLPDYIATDLHAVREVGNLAAHPIKDQHAGQIVDVEPGEAEWNLEVLDQLFDFYYVRPARAKSRRDALNQKLTSAGRKPV